MVSCDWVCRVNEKLKELSDLIDGIDSGTVKSVDSVLPSNDGNIQLNAVVPDPDTGKIVTILIDTGESEGQVLQAGAQLLEGDVLFVRPDGTIGSKAESAVGVWLGTFTSVADLPSTANNADEADVVNDPDPANDGRYKFSTAWEKINSLVDMTDYELLVNKLNVNMPWVISGDRYPATDAVEARIDTKIAAIDIPDPDPSAVLVNQYMHNLKILGTGFTIGCLVIDNDPTQILSGIALYQRLFADDHHAQDKAVMISGFVGSGYYPFAMYSNGTTTSGDIVIMRVNTSNVMSVYTINPSSLVFGDILDEVQSIDGVYH